MDCESRVTWEYRDPLALIWLHAAAALGMRVEHSREVYASWDGRGTLRLAPPDAWDQDDSWAQLVLHEICHGLVAGPASVHLPDWGLTNGGARDLVWEHATHRLQASLADQYGMRKMLAATTEHRPYYDALPADPLAPGNDPAIELAREGWQRARTGSWGPALQQALERTRALVDSVEDSAPPHSWWALAEPMHTTGFVLHPDSTRRCGDCAWSHARGSRLCCRQAKAAAARVQWVSAQQRGCTRWEGRLLVSSCAQCGACCREAFHLVPVRRSERLHERHPELVAGQGRQLHIPRPEGRCLALSGAGTDVDAYRCSIYPVRPKSCQQFEVGGDACLTARRRVGLSR